MGKRRIKREARRKRRSKRRKMMRKRRNRGRKRRKRRRERRKSRKKMRARRKRHSKGKICSLKTFTSRTFLLTLVFFIAVHCCQACTFIKFLIELNQ